MSHDHVSSNNFSPLKITVISTPRFLRQARAHCAPHLHVTHAPLRPRNKHLTRASVANCTSHPHCVAHGRAGHHVVQAGARYDPIATLRQHSSVTTRAHCPRPARRAPAPAACAAFKQHRQPPRMPHLCFYRRRRTTRRLPVRRHPHTATCHTAANPHRPAPVRNGANIWKQLLQRVPEGAVSQQPPQPASVDTLLNEAAKLAHHVDELRRTATTPLHDLGWRLVHGYRGPRDIVKCQTCGRTMLLAAFEPHRYEGGGASHQRGCAPAATHIPHPRHIPLFLPMFLVRAPSFHHHSLHTSFTASPTLCTACNPPIHTLPCTPGPTVVGGVESPPPRCPCSTTAPLWAAARALDVSRAPGCAGRAGQLHRLGLV